MRIPRAELEAVLRKKIPNREQRVDEILCFVQNNSATQIEELSFSTETVFAIIDFGQIRDSARSVWIRYYYRESETTYAKVKHSYYITPMGTRLISSKGTSNIQFIL